MIRGIEAVHISTSREGFEKMVAFYRDTVGLEVDFEGEMGEKDQATGFKVGEGNLYLMTNEKVRGGASDSGRVMVNIEVDDIEKEEPRLKEKGAKQIESIYHIEGYGYVSTFADPDGNHFQIVQVRET